MKLVREKEQQSSHEVKIGQKIHKIKHFIKSNQGMGGGAAF